MIRRRRVRRMVPKQQPEPDTSEGIGPDGKLLPGYRYAKGGKVVKASK